MKIPLKETRIPIPSDPAKEAWEKFSKHLETLCWPDRPDGYIASIPEEVLRRKLKHLLLLKEYADASDNVTFGELFFGEIGLLYDGLFWRSARKMSRDPADYEQHGIVDPSKGIFIPATEKFAHHGKQIWLYDLGPIGNFKELWVVVIGDTINNFFLSKAEDTPDGVVYSRPQSMWHKAFFKKDTALAAIDAIKA